MVQPAKTDLPETPASTDEPQALSLSAPDEACGHHGQSARQEIEYLLKLVAHLEACNMVLLNKLNQAERELAMLAALPKTSLPEMKYAGHGEQAYGWERKLTRTQWRPE